jgi:hypothetical protein
MGKRRDERGGGVERKKMDKGKRRDGEERSGVMD